MKNQITRHTLSSVLVFLLSTGLIKAQLCMNPTDTLYGLNSVSTGSGQMVGININDLGGVNIGSPAASSANANGVGFSVLTGKFYFFNQCGSGITEFVSFDPLTGSKMPLAIPSSPIIPTGQKIRTGTMTPDGVGYYTIYPGATTAQGFPVTGPAFYYYSVGADSWTLITQSFKDTAGHTVTEFTSLNSGDMAFDGSGNLWVVVSKSPNYALYKITGPLPTSPVASITVDTVIASTAIPGGVSVTGIAFNAAGELYMSTGSLTTSAPGIYVSDGMHNLLFKMTSPSAPLDSLGELPNGYGDDLTSCSTPLAVLASDAISLNATYANKMVSLKWKISKNSGAARFEVEYSTDNTHWGKIADVPRNDISTGLIEQYAYAHHEYVNGANYYRIKQVSVNGEIKYSSISKLYITENNFNLSISPNPASDILFIKGLPDTRKYYANVYDQSGRLCISASQLSSGNSISVASLKNGFYIVQLFDNTGNCLGASRFIRQD